MKQLITLIVFFGSLTCVSGQPKEDSLAAKLDEYFAALTDLKNFNGNVIVAVQGKKLLDNTYNIAGETDNMKVTRDSKFIIASVSKVFIRFGILKLAESEKLQLSDKLNKYIPDFPNGERITIEQLIHHQSGLPRELTDNDSYDSLSLPRIVELAKMETLQFEPGTQTLYSNVGYFLLHYIIDKISDNGYLSFIENEIFKKMQLNNTLEFNSTRSVPEFAYGFNNDEGKIVPASQRSLHKFETGNYLSTTDDLYSFSQQLVSGKALKKSIAPEMFGKDSVLIQAGGRSGYRAYFYMNLKTEVTFIFLSNYTDIPFQEVTSDVIHILEHKPYEIPHKINRVEIPLSTEILKKYTGKFALEADLTQLFSIELIDDKLFFMDPDGEKTEMHPDSENTFFDTPTTKDGYVFMLNETTNQYDLILIDTGIKLKTKRLE